MSDDEESRLIGISADKHGREFHDHRPRQDSSESPLVAQELDEIRVDFRADDHEQKSEREEEVVTEIDDSDDEEAFERHIISVIEEIQSEKLVDDILNDNFEEDNVTQIEELEENEEEKRNSTFGEVDPRPDLTVAAKRGSVVSEDYILLQEIVDDLTRDQENVASRPRSEEVNFF